MTDKNDDEGVAEVLIIFLLIAVLAVGGIAYFMGDVINTPTQKSDRELCEERGGVYVSPYRSKDMCLSKDAFK